MLLLLLLLIIVVLQPSPRAPPNRDRDRALTFERWIPGAELAEELADTYWPADRSLALRSHHRTVRQLVGERGWAIAREYDIRQ